MDVLPAGPFRTVVLDDETTVPWYVVPFDGDGECEAPRTRADLLAAAGMGRYSDVFVFSHGWNNTWPTAIGRYEDFLNGYTDLKRRYRLPVSPDYKPLLAGIFWPSAALVGSDEQAPQMAGSIAAQAEEREQIARLAQSVEPGATPRLYELLQSETLGEAESLELASLVRGIYAIDTEEIPDDVAPTPDDIVAMWSGWAESRSPGDEDAAIAALGRIGRASDAAELQAAGFLGKLNPRDILRATTVWQMKDRAGRVGGRGVSTLLVDLLANTTARVHLIGHSYGGKVVLSAVGAASALPRNVRSMLLLQPAVSHLCFATKIPGRHAAGGYALVPDRVELPILTTYSEHDFPLRKTFHLALRRKRDLGEQQIAAPGSPPSIHAALGGFGPHGVDDTVAYVDMKPPTQTYEPASGTQIVGVDGSEFIADHGAISNAATWWALYQLATGGDAS